MSETKRELINAKRKQFNDPDYMARWLRGACSSGDPLHRALNLVLDDFERRGKVEQAAADFVKTGLCGGYDHVMPNSQREYSQHLSALIEAVQTNENFDG